MKSLVVKHSIVIDGYKTSVSLEEVFWNSLKEIARARGESAAQLIAHIDANRRFANLSSAIRLFVLEFYREQFNCHSGIVAHDVVAARSAQRGGR
jgi:predicted DNA-binding ribbon-helix-helix protein